MRIAIYSRKSKETDTGESIKTQIKLCKEYFQRLYKDCTFEIFEDEGYSGGNTNRPAFQRMIQLARAKQFDVVAAYKLDRISRNTLEFLTMYEDLKTHDVQLVSITEGFDPSTPSGKMMMGMISSMAEMERMNIAQRVKDNMNELAKMGRWSGGTCPTGLRSTVIEANGKKETYLEYIPDMEITIVKIFNKIAEGLTTCQVGKELGLSPRSIYNIVTNPVYLESNETSAKYLESIGYSVYGELNGNGFIAYNRRPKKNGKKLFNSKDMFVSVSRHKGLINAHTWIKANKNLKLRGSEAKPRVSLNSFLSHMVKCKCGSGMFVHPGSKNRLGEPVYYFRCSSQKATGGCDAKWVRVLDVENIFLEILKEVSLDKRKLDDYINSKKDIDYDSLIKDQKRQVQKLTNDIVGLTEKLVLIEGPAIKIITDKINEASKELEKLQNDLFDLERQKIFQDQDKINIDTLYNSIVYLLSVFNEMVIEDKQIAIKSVLEEIRYNGEDEIKVVFRGGK